VEVDDSISGPYVGFTFRGLRDSRGDGVRSQAKGLREKGEGARHTARRGGGGG